MQNYIGEPYNNMAIMEYAPADFPDSEDTRPPESYLDSGSQTPATIYSTTVANTLQRHFRDVRDRNVSAINYSANWKKKIRDIFVRGNESVLGFLTKPVSSHPSLSQVEQLIRRYSRTEVQHQPNHILRDVVSDISGVDTFSFIQERLYSKMSENVVVSLGDQVKEIYDMYRELMDAIVEKDIALKTKLNVLDKVQPRLIMLLDLGVNETTTELQGNIQAYLEKTYLENNPEPEYQELLVLYKKLLAVRDLVQLLRISGYPDKEPICGICLNDTVMYALVPCGHTYCEGCSRRQSSTCFLCRQSSTQRIKIFFG
jgi:hypothetical protein